MVPAVSTSSPRALTLEAVVVVEDEEEVVVEVDEEVVVVEGDDEAEATVADSSRCKIFTSVDLPAPLGPT